MSDAFFTPCHIHSPLFRPIIIISTLAIMVSLKKKFAASTISITLFILFILADLAMTFDGNGFNWRTDLTVVPTSWS